MNKLKLLFQPFPIGKLELKNRIIMSPMGLNFTEDFVNDRLIEFFVKRAQGGAGLIIVSAGCVDPVGKIAFSLGLYDDKFIPGLNKLTNAVHEYGAKIGIHILHGGKYSFSKVTGTQSVSPSAIFSQWTKEMPRELTIPEIKEIVKNYAKAVKRAKEAGFDLIEYNAYSGYLIREFLSPSTNKRTDEYGGTLKNRIRFFKEIIEETKKEVGDDYPLVAKISGNEYIPEGNSLQEAIFIARELKKSDVAALHVSPGGHDSTVPLTPGFVPKGAFLFMAEAIKKEVRLPVITAHLGDLFLAEKAIEEGKADLVAIGRGFLADPAFPNKAREGRFVEINQCCRCLQGCYDRVFMGQEVSCLVNPAVGKERELEIKPALQKKKVVIVGGGPAGMEAARVLAFKGHEVILYEKEKQLGGQLKIASVAPGKEEFQNIINYLAQQLEISGVKVILGEKATQELIENEKPDAVIVATGAVPASLNIPGIDSRKVVYANQVLSGEVKTGQKVAIIGGGGIGCEVALYLAKEGAMKAQDALFLINWGAVDTEAALSLNRKGSHEITILEKLPSIGADLGISRRGPTRRFLALLGVNTVTSAEAKAITDRGVEFINIDGTLELIEAETVVIAAGTQSENNLYQELQGKVPLLFLIGDGKKPGKSFDAIHEGYIVASEI